MDELSGMQIRKNFITNVAYYAINILIGVFLVPYFISTLGIAAYGLIPLATSMVGYLGILTNSLNAAVSRHLTIDMQNPDKSIPNTTFNSALFGFSKLVLILSPFVLLLAFFVPKLFNVSSEYAIDASWLFIGIGFAFLVRAWSSSFTVTLYGLNRFDLINIINFINIFTQIVSIVILFSFNRPSLASVGASYLLGALAATCIAYFLHRMNSDSIEIKYKHYNSRKFYEMAQLGIWIIVDEIGSLLLLNIDLIVVNFLFGNTTGGTYAIAYQWVGLLRGVATTFVSILGPIILIAYATKQKEKIVYVSKSAVKLTGIGIALPIGFICGLAPSILGVWVGNQFEYLAPLMILLTLHLVINTAVISLFKINVAYNKVRLPAIVTLVSGGVDLALALIFTLWLGWGIYGVALASIISQTFRNFIFTPLNASMVMGVPKLTYYPSLLPGAISAVCIMLATKILSMYIDINSITMLIIVGGIVTLIYALICLKYVMNEAELALIHSKAKFS